MDCSRNRIKNGKRKQQQNDETPKKPKISTKRDELSKRYPIRNVGCTDDPDSIELHKRALSEELSKSKPRESVLRTLMKSTYNQRRAFVQNDACSVKEILKYYPALYRPAVVSVYSQFCCLWFTHFY